MASEKKLSRRCNKTLSHIQGKKSRRMHFRRKTNSVKRGRQKKHFCTFSIAGKTVLLLLASKSKCGYFWIFKICWPSYGLRNLGGKKRKVFAVAIIGVINSLPFPLLFFLFRVAYALLISIFFGKKKNVGKCRSVSHNSGENLLDARARDIN